jgi:altronate dehydratase small subunit
MDAADNVGNAIEDISKGDQVVYSLDGANQQFTAVDDIAFGFKVAVKDIPAQDPIVKYGQTTGIASRAIAAGECVHIHNVEGKRGRGDLQGGKS